jgi:hypothetical protein
MAESARTLLEGIARALSEEVAPHVSDRYAQMQCKAAAELLANLATELEYAPAPIERDNDELRALLGALAAGGWRESAPGSPSRADASGPPERVRAALLAEVAEALRWLAAQPAELQRAVDTRLAADLERQVAALRRGMFR